ncbi:MAG: FkbM family methyltransferase [Bryobacteraceae bacterium]|nr:FkbM family methyltransferase [Bryobacteraceae bacterium]
MMPLFRRSRDTAQTLAHSWHARSVAVGRLCAELRLPRGAARQRGSQVLFPELGFQAPLWAAERLLRGYKLLRELKRAFPDSFRLHLDSDRVLLAAAGITLNVRTWGDIDVMHEILVRELYRFQLARPCVVWDVGMNVGMASLYFASMPEVAAVHAYELFGPTAEQARANFALNQQVAPKITSFPCGIGARSEILELPYHEDIKGVVGLQGPMITTDAALRRERVEVMPAAEALNRLRLAYPTLPIVLKMDCEGAEGDIFDTLAAENRLHELTLILMEWHGPGMRLRLEALLARHGFVSTSQPFPGGQVGALTAFRSTV